MGPWSHDHPLSGEARFFARHGRHRGREGRSGHAGGSFGGSPGGGNPWGGNPFFRLFHRGPRARRGDVRAGILVLLAEQPRNGYQIMQELEQRSGGQWRPSPGSVYPALQQLEDEGLVRVEESAGGRAFQLTESGRAWVKEHADELGAPWDAFRSAAGDEVMDLLRLCRQLGIAAMQVAHAGNAAQIAQARKVVADARRALYRLLAEDAPEESE